MFKKLLLTCILTTVIYIAPALAQRGPVGIGVDLHGAYVSMTDNSFEDPELRPNIAHGWLNNVSSGLYFDGRLSIRLPFGLHPYVGYHIGHPGESAPNTVLWSNIYGGIPNFENNFTEHSHDTNYRTEGWNAGITYEPHWLGWTVKPYLIGEIRTEKFKAETKLEGYAENVPGLCCIVSGPFEGTSIMEAETVYGYGVGLGVRIPMRRLGFAMPFGALSLVPEVKYVSAPDAQIERREFEWTIYPEEESIVRTTHGGFLDILDGQTIDHRHIAFRLGLRYELF